MTIKRKIHYLLNLNVKRENLIREMYFRGIVTRRNMNRKMCFRENDLQGNGSREM
jgi:hypothetical protein